MNNKNFKDGDFLRKITPNGIRVVIYKSTDKDGAIITYAGGLINKGTHLTTKTKTGWGFTNEYEKAGKLEIDFFVERLNDEFNLKWNKNKKRLECIGKRVHVGLNYFYITPLCCVVSKTEFHEEVDNNLFNIGNYFTDYYEAEAYANKIKQIFNNNK